MRPMQIGEPAFRDSRAFGAREWIGLRQLECRLRDAIREEQAAVQWPVGCRVGLPANRNR